MPENNGTHEIRSRRPQGFWRCGRHFGKGWQTYDRSDFTDEEWERISKERQLLVRPLAGDEAQAEDPAPDGGDPPKEEAGAGGDDPPALEPLLKDGRRRCRHVYESGNQCTYAAYGDSDYCEKHQAEHAGEAGE